MQGEGRTLHGVLGGVDSFSEEQPRKKHKLELKQAPALEAEAATCNDHKQRRSSEFSILDVWLKDKIAFADACESLFKYWNIEESNELVVCPINESDIDCLKRSSLQSEFLPLDDELDNFIIDQDLVDAMEALIDSPPEQVTSDLHC